MINFDAKNGLGILVNQILQRLIRDFCLLIYLLDAITQDNIKQHTTILNILTHPLYLEYPHILLSSTATKTSQHITSYHNEKNKFNINLSTTSSIIFFLNMAFFGYNYPQQQQKLSRDIDIIIQPINGKGGLFLGNYKAASNTRLLQQYKIGAVLTAAIESDIHYDHSIVPYHMIVEGYDVENFDLQEYFDEASKFIHDSLEVTNTFVHCMAGISRSTTLLIAYLIRYRGVKSDDALNLVRSKRSIVNPNSGFWSQLKQYQKIIYKRRAKRSGANMPNYVQKPSTPQHRVDYNSGNGYNQLFMEAAYPVQPMGYDPFGYGGFF